MPHFETVLPLVMTECIFPKNRRPTRASTNRESPFSLLHLPHPLLLLVLTLPCTKINAAAALVARNDPSSTTAPLDHPLHEQSGYNGVEPRVAKLDNDIINDDRQNGLAGTADAANIGCVQHSTLHEQGHHPSFAISRDSGARGPSSLGPDGAATLLQSRFRGYRSRRLVANDCAGIRGGAGARKGDGDADHDLALAQKGYAVGGAEGREERSVLDLEVSRQSQFCRSAVSK